MELVQAPHVRCGDLHELKSLLEAVRAVSQESVIEPQHHRSQEVDADEKKQPDKAAGTVLPARGQPNTFNDSGRGMESGGGIVGEADAGALFEKSTEEHREGGAR